MLVAHALLLAATAVVEPSDGRSALLFESQPSAQNCVGALMAAAERKKNNEQHLAAIREHEAAVRSQLATAREQGMKSMTDQEYVKNRVLIRSLEADLATGATAPEGLQREEEEAEAQARSVCVEATAASLVSGVELEILKRPAGSALIQVKVLTGKHGGVIGWIATGQIKENVAAPAKTPRPARSPR